MPVRRERMRFPGADGSSLDARLDLPLSTPIAYALFAHCFTCSKDVLAASRISRALAERGIAVLRFDFTGLGHSDGEFANTNFSSNIADLLAAVEYLRAEHQAPSILIGHSLGGAAVLAAAVHVPEAVAVATINGLYDPAELRGLLGAAAEDIEARGEAPVTLAGREFRIQRQFLEDIGGQRLDTAIAGMNKALLVFQAPEDEIIDPANGQRIYEAAPGPKNFITLDGANHLLTRKADSTYVATVLAAWASRYVKPAAGPGALEAEPGTVIVAETGQGTFTQAINAVGHLLRGDEPVSVPGGMNTGPAPYDFLLAGLGACTSMTLRMYAERKGIPLERTVVRLQHQKIHAKDCEECETTVGKIDRIDREIELSGPLDDTQRQRLLEIADRCPVHRTLESEIRIATRLSDEAHGA